MQHSATQSKSIKCSRYVTIMIHSSRTTRSISRWAAFFFFEMKGLSRKRELESWCIRAILKVCCVSYASILCIHPRRHGIDYTKTGDMKILLQSFRTWHEHIQVLPRKPVPAPRKNWFPSSCGLSFVVQLLNDTWLDNMENQGLPATRESSQLRCCYCTRSWGEGGVHGLHSFERKLFAWVA